jgi:hypothetical protein
MSQEIVMLQHLTTTSNLLKILASGKLLSPQKLGLKPPIWNKDYGTYVFLTPSTTTEFRRSKDDTILHLDAKGLMAKYPRFFINNGNSFRPLNGQMKPYTRKNGDCGCNWTYNTLTSVEGPCVKKTLKEIESVLQYDMNVCDGGPEIGFPDEIEILEFLKGITLSKSDYESLKDKVPTEILPLLLPNTNGGKRRKRKTRRMRRSRKQVRA